MDAARPPTIAGAPTCPNGIYHGYKGEDRCLCGLPRRAHRWIPDGRGGLIGQEPEGA